MVVSCRRGTGAFGCNEVTLRQSSPRSDPVSRAEAATPGSKASTSRQHEIRGDEVQLLLLGH